MSLVGCMASAQSSTELVAPARSSMRESHSPVSPGPSQNEFSHSVCGAAFGDFIPPLKFDSPQVQSLIQFQVEPEVYVAGSNSGQEQQTAVKLQKFLQRRAALHGALSNGKLLLLSALGEHDVPGVDGIRFGSSGTRLLSFKASAAKVKTGQGWRETSMSLLNSAFKAFDRAQILDTWLSTYQPLAHLRTKGDRQQAERRSAQNFEDMYLGLSITGFQSGKRRYPLTVVLDLLDENVESPPMRLNTYDSHYGEVVHPMILLGDAEEPYSYLSIPELQRKLRPQDQIIIFKGDRAIVIQPDTYEELQFTP